MSPQPLPALALTSHPEHPRLAKTLGKRPPSLFQLLALTSQPEHPRLAEASLRPLPPSSRGFLPLCLRVLSF